jgi:ABC-type sugar transport system permease subunit
VAHPAKEGLTMAALRAEAPLYSKLDDRAAGGAETLRRRRRREALSAYAMIAPALGAFVLFMAIPMLLTLTLSFFNWSGISFGSLDFAGLSNYRKMLQDEVFWQALSNNGIFILVGMTASVGLGMFVAVLLERGLKGSSFFRGLFYLPTVLSTVVIGIVFTFLLSPVFGIINPILSGLGIDAKVALLGDPGAALWTLIGVETWRMFGFAMFLFVAGLKSLDENLNEAAAIDGASGWQAFWHVTFPQLRPVTLMVATLVGISMLKLFDLVYVMTGGGPQHATEVLNTMSYYQGFQYNSVGYGSTIAVVLLFITFGLTLLRFKVLPDERPDMTGRHGR